MCNKKINNVEHKNECICIFIYARKKISSTYFLSSVDFSCVWRISFRGFILSPRTTFKNSIQCVHWIRNNHICSRFLTTFSEHEHTPIKMGNCDSILPCVRVKNVCARLIFYENRIRYPVQWLDKYIFFKLLELISFEMKAKLPIFLILHF